ncbi:MAG: hypothetical protein CMM87_06880 [Rickettsiales bacterium]|nr:hypothetical protein [Rickettsiales bacterium]|tara:strand:+ start:886 stop:1650 length:765 start_codon:yes stop_codon:yes gene_type:complete
MPQSQQSRPCALKLPDAVCFLLTIPFIGVVVCVAQARADGAAASTISEMVTVNRDMEIVFAISMGAASLAIASAMWLLALAITRHNHFGTSPPFFMVFLLLTVLMIFGCGALARFTLRSDAGAHVIYAAIAFVSQWIMLSILIVAGYRRIHSKNKGCFYGLSCVFCFVAFVCLVMFGLNVTSKSFYFEFGLVICMYISTCFLAWVPWNNYHHSDENQSEHESQTATDVNPIPHSIISVVYERMSTRFTPCAAHA